MRSAVTLLVLLAGGVFLCGCGPTGPALGRVSGTVTVDGKPVPNAMVTFTPVEAGGTYSMGKTDATGKYTLGFTQDRNGALVGEHNVSIQTKKISKDEMPDTGEPVDIAFVAIPAKYGKLGTLKAEVKNQNNTIDFALESK